MSRAADQRDIRENLYGLRSARDCAEQCEAYGNLAEANRHRKRARGYAESIRNIIRERSGSGPYLAARQELRT